MKQALIEIFWLAAVVGLSIFGFLLASYDMANISNLPGYNPYVLNGLLATGLYASVYGINISEVKNDWKIVLRVITIGVALKTVLIGAIVFYFTRNELAFVFAVIVAQIDPLSVSALTNDLSNRLGQRGKNLLLAWASFDDPVTVIAAIFIASYVLSTSLVGEGNYLAIQLMNFGVPAIGFALHKSFQSNKYVDAILLIIVFTASIYFSLMLAVAISALFLRPPIDRFVEIAVKIAFALSLVLVGTYLVTGVDVTLSATLAAAAIVSQIVATLVLANKFGSRDVAYLAFAQQNGITAIILSLLLGAHVEGVVSVVALTVFMVNIFHVAAFAILEMIFSAMDKRKISAGLR